MDFLDFFEGVQTPLIQVLLGNILFATILIILTIVYVYMMLQTLISKNKIKRLHLSQKICFTLLIVLGWGELSFRTIALYKSHVMRTARVLDLKCLHELMANTTRKASYFTMMLNGLKKLDYNFWVMCGYDEWASSRVIPYSLQKKKLVRRIPLGIFAKLSHRRCDKIFGWVQRHWKSQKVLNLRKALEKQLKKGPLQFQDGMSVKLYGEITNYMLTCYVESLKAMHRIMELMLDLGFLNGIQLKSIKFLKQIIKTQKKINQLVQNWEQYKHQDYNSMDLLFDVKLAYDNLIEYFFDPRLKIHFFLSLPFLVQKQYRLGPAHAALFMVTSLMDQFNEAWRNYGRIRESALSFSGVASRSTNILQLLKDAHKVGLKPRAHLKRGLQTFFNMFSDRLNLKFDEMNITHQLVARRLICIECAAVTDTFDSFALLTLKKRNATIISLDKQLIRKYYQGVSPPIVLCRNRFHTQDS